MSDEPKLLPCPFCGEPPDEIWIYGNRISPNPSALYAVRHTCCPGHGDSKQEAAQSWNTRADHALVAEAYEVCANYHRTEARFCGDVGHTDRYLTHTQSIRDIRALAAADAIAAREARDAEVRKQALREAAALIDDESKQSWEHWGEDKNVRVAQTVAKEIQNTILALIEKEDSLTRETDRQGVLKEAAEVCKSMLLDDTSQLYSEGYNRALERAAWKIQALNEKDKTNE